MTAGAMSLAELPAEVLDDILQQVNVKELVRLKVLCKTVSLATDDVLVRRGKELLGEHMACIYVTQSRLFDQDQSFTTQKCTSRCFAAIEKTPAQDWLDLLSRSAATWYSFASKEDTCVIACGPFGFMSVAVDLLAGPAYHQSLSTPFVADVNVRFDRNTIKPAQSELGVLHIREAVDLIYRMVSESGGSGAWACKIELIALVVNTAELLSCLEKRETEATRLVLVQPVYFLHGVSNLYIR